MKHQIYILAFLMTTLSCQSQTNKAKVDKLVGGPCEGCEAIFEYGKRYLTSVDTLPAFHQTDPKIKISGTVFEKDGKTPAENIIIYAYHTNREGIYETKGNEKGWANRHGYIRGWTKTDADGKYTFFTFRPAAYPNGLAPEHIHLIVKEPDKSEYYIDDIMFEDDPNLSESEKNRLANRAGSGLVTLNKQNGIMTAKRDIILGLNIPNYD